VLLEELETLGDRVTITGTNAGIHLVAWLPEIPVSQTQTLLQQAAAAGVGLYSVAPYYRRSPPQTGLLMGYASLSEGQIREGVARLRDVLDARRGAR